jgi:hypothetical protein
MLLYKSCPKCRGDLGVERDLFRGPPDLVCLQCGYIARPQERAALLARAMGHPASAPAPAPLVRRAS